jgi:poly(A) polymerase
MLRAARFIAGYALEPEPQLLEAVHELAPRMAIVSVERRRDELDKLLSVTDPAPGLQFLVDHGLALLVLPELAHASGEARLRVLTSLRGLAPDPVLRLAAILSVDDEPDLARLRGRLRDARYSNDVSERVMRLAQGAAMVWRHDGPWTPSQVRRLAFVAKADLDDAVSLASIRIDVTEVRRAIDSIRTHEDLQLLEPALDGDAVMALLGLTPGVSVGEALSFLRELRLEEGVLAEDDARGRLEAWWQRRSAG